MDNILNYPENTENKKFDGVLLCGHYEDWNWDKKIKFIYSAIETLKIEVENNK